jgi:hypothetical protein
MADIIKVLGQLDAAATTEEDLYPVPNVTVATCSTLVICNRTASSIDFRVSVAPAAAVTSDEQYLFYDAPIAGNTTITVTIGMTLAQLDVVRTYASATGLSFNLFGVETDNT